MWAVISPDGPKEGLPSRHYSPPDSKLYIFVESSDPDPAVVLYLNEMLLIDGGDGVWELQARALRVESQLPIRVDTIDGETCGWGCVWG